jgi:mannose-6-phosphate isomerase-like protein (cupin superfamily)
MNVINLADKFNQFNDYWHPRIVGELNGSYVKVTKLKGEFVWHKHHNEDEMFLVVKGTLKMCMRQNGEDCEQTLTIHEGEFLIVPKGVDHYPIAEEEVYVMLLEPVTTVNTGNVRDERTQEAEWL